MWLILIGFALIALIDLIPLIRKHSGRGALAFLLFFIPALTLTILLVYKVEVPSIMLLLGSLFKTLGISY